MNHPKQLPLPFPIATTLDRQAANDAAGHPPSYVPERKRDPFYASKEWRRARAAVLARDGARCKIDGRTAAECAHIEVHHIIPKSEAPHLAVYLSNLEVLCDECHEQKHYRMSLRQPLDHFVSFAASRNRR